MATSHASDRLKLGRRREPFATTPHWIICAGLTPQAQALYTILMAHVNEESAEDVAFPGMESLAKLLGFSRRQSVSRYLDELAAVGAISVTKKVRNGARRNTYEIHETPPPDYTGPRTLKAFYDQQKAAKRKAREDRAATDDGSTCATAHIGTCAGAHTGTCATAHMNKTKGTRRRELDEEDASSGDAARGGPRASSRARPPEPKPIRILLPADFDTLDEPQVWQYLVRAAISAARHAGRPLGRGAGDHLGRSLKATQGLPRYQLAAELEAALNRGAAGDPEWAFLFRDDPTPKRPPAPADPDELHDRLDHIPGAATAIEVMWEQGYHPNAIENTVLATAGVMA